MSIAESKASGEEQEQEELARLSPMPTVTMGGIVEGVITSASLDDDQNGSSFGVIFNGLRYDGTLLREHQKAQGELTTVRESGDKAGSRPVDYRLVDEDDDSTNVVNDQFTDRGGNVYVPSEGIDEERVVVWFNGMSGQFAGRTLDFNGRPFASYTDSGYLVKGLFQVCEEWRNANSSRRRELVKDGLAPRVARAPVLREDLVGQDVTIYLGRYNGGRGYEFFAFLTDDLEGRDPLDMSTEEMRDVSLDMVYSEDADDVLTREGITMHTVHGVGWQDVPDNAQDVSFDVTSMLKDEAKQGPSKLDKFVQSVARAIEGPELEPDDAFEGGLEAVMAQYGVTGDVDEIRRLVYAEAAHLDETEL